MLPEDIIAVRVTGTALTTVMVLILKFTSDEPAGIVTLSGTSTSVEFELSEIFRPPVCATPLSKIMARVEFPPTTGAGVGPEIEWSVGVRSVNTVETELPFRVAVTEVDASDLSQGTGTLTLVLPVIVTVDGTGMSRLLEVRFTKNDVGCCGKSERRKNNRAVVPPYQLAGDKEID